MPYKANEPRRHKIPRARYKVRNWPEYDRALQLRGSLTVWVTPEALRLSPPRSWDVAPQRIAVQVLHPREIEPFDELGVNLTLQFVVVLRTAAGGRAGLRLAALPGRLRA